MMRAVPESFTCTADNGAAVHVRRMADDWRAIVTLADGRQVERWYSVWRRSPDLGLCRVTREIRREFGITGRYTPDSTEILV